MRFAHLTLVLALAVGASITGAAARAHAQPLLAPVGPDLLAQAASPDPAVRIDAIARLEAQRRPAALNLIVVMLQRDVDPRVRAAAAAAAGRSRDGAYLDALEYAAHYDYDPYVRATARAAADALFPFTRRPKMAAGLSVLCPGCGYFYLHQPGRALAYMGTTGALIASAVVVDENSPPDRSNMGTGRATPLYTAAQELWMYGIYAAYRDARLARGDDGWRYPVAREQLDDLLLAPFNPHVLKSPYVWVGVPVTLGAAAAFTLIASKLTHEPITSTRTLGDPGGVTFFGQQFSKPAGFALGEGFNATIYAPVAAAEEALFRGVIQAGLSETSLGLWGGWAAGSAIFGGAHIVNFLGAENGARNAAIAVPYIMLTGSYLGYVFVKKNFSLLTGTAIHFWYDFALSTIDFIADPDHQPFTARFAIPF
jgi:membrane protease YdiL (CAAX protease family)